MSMVKVTSLLVKGGSELIPTTLLSLTTPLSPLTGTPEAILLLT